MKHKLYPIILTVLSIGLAAGGAYAAMDRENDALGVTKAKIDLVQAVTAAEQQVDGKASHAEYEHLKGKNVYAIEVVKDRSVMDVTVDGDSGKVIEARADKIDRAEAKDDGERDDD